MANSYKFTGVALATVSETALLTAAADETLIIKSIRITNNTANTPTISFDVLDNSAKDYRERGYNEAMMARMICEQESSDG